MTAEHLATLDRHVWERRQVGDAMRLFYDEDRRWYVDMRDDVVVGCVGPKFLCAPPLSR